MPETPFDEGASDSMGADLDARAGDGSLARGLAGPAPGRALMHAVLAAGLIVLGLLGCALGVLVWASIARSDTATWVLVGFGLTFAVPGLAAIGMGAWLLRRGWPGA